MEESGMEPTGGQIREAVRERYASAAREVQARQASSCCSTGSCDCGNSALYDPRQLAEIPEGAALASLGCGNPTLLAQLREGETVLDLGSGGGIDVLLSAKRVGGRGRAYGLDMTDEMLELARANAREAKVQNVEFLKGQIEAVPLPDAAVDVIISNCVINLSADKDAVLREAFRVLKPGGRFAVADVVVQGRPMPVELRQALALWAECVSGALTDEEYRAKLGAAGFEDVEIQVLHAHDLGEVPEEYHDLVPPSVLERADTADTKVVSAFVRATKPGPVGASPRRAAVPLPVVGQSSCCGPTASRRA